MKHNTALNTALAVRKIGVYVAVALGAVACSSLRPMGHDDGFRDKLKAPELTAADQAAPQVTLPIERLPSDTFWVRPQISEGELPDRMIENLSVTERGLFDVLQIIFASTNMPLSFEGGADSASRYGVVTLNNLSGNLSQVMNRLGEIMGFFWTVTESGVLRIMPDQQFVVTMPPVLNEDSMDTMQSAIDLNIQKIAENTVAIQTNAKAIERLDDALFSLDGKVKNNTDLIEQLNARWSQNFTVSEDGATLAVNAVELKASNFTAQQVRANSLYSQRLEAEMARIAELEVNNLSANTAVANTVQAEQVNTGSTQVYAGVGLPAVLFAAKADGHYTVSTSALDGSYATATVIVNAGQAKVVSVASEGIELYAEGNVVKVLAAGKSIKASWIKMG